MSEIKISRLIFLLGFAIAFQTLISCTKEKESEYNRTVRLLTDGSMKDWSMGQLFIDDVSHGISKCDSSYVLTLKSDLSWQEIFYDISCYQISDGFWSLNDQANVITIGFIDQNNGQPSERKFEIVELDEDTFSYQFAEDNQLTRIELTKR